MPSRTVRTVLMIDENEVLCSAISIVLRTQGFRVLLAHDGRSGVDLFQVHEPEIDVIVMELTLPRLSGHEALRELQRIRPGVKVILTASFSKRALVDLHPWAFLQKPYLSTELIDLLQKAGKPDSE